VAEHWDISYFPTFALLTIDQLTYKLGQDQMTAEDQKAKDEAIARVNN
jgi:hypothetical protein